MLCTTHPPIQPQSRLQIEQTVRDEISGPDSYHLFLGYVDTVKEYDSLEVVNEALWHTNP